MKIRNYNIIILHFCCYYAFSESVLDPLSDADPIRSCSRFTILLITTTIGKCPMSDFKLDFMSSHFEKVMPRNAYHNGEKI